MSADLQWLCIRKNHSFIVKSNGVTLSSEPNNLTNKHSFKYNGLVNKKVVGVSEAENGVVLTTKTNKKNKPSKSLNNVVLKRGSRRAMNSIKNATKYYRR